LAISQHKQFSKENMTKAKQKKAQPAYQRAIAGVNSGFV